MTEPVIPHVVVFGDVIDDIIVTPLGDIRPDTDTSAEIARHAGGSAANAATWFAELGCAVDFFGHVGSPDVAAHSALLAQHGVSPHLSGAELPTGTIVVVLQPDRTRTMLTSRGANALTSPQDVPRELLRPGAHLHFTGYSVFGAGEADAGSAFAELIGSARAAGASVSVNPGSAGFIAEHGAAPLLAAMAGATVILPNLDEGRALTGAWEPDDVVGALLEQHDVVVLTLGREGAIAATRRSGCVRAAAVPVTPRDTTGAGDAFGAAFTTSLLRTADPATAAAGGGLGDIGRSRLEAALLAGITTAATAITQVGARPPLGSATPGWALTVPRLMP